MAEGNSVDSKTNEEMSIVNGGRILDLRYPKDLNAIQKISDNRTVATEDSRDMLSSFVNESLKRAGKKRPVLYCVSLKHNLTVQSLSYFDGSQMCYRVAINFIARTFSEDDLNSVDGLRELPAFKSFKLDHLEASQREEVVTDISAAIGRMKDYLTGEGVDPK